MKHYFLIGLAGFILALAGKYFLWKPSSAPVENLTQQLPEIQLNLQEPCDLHEMACMASDEVGHIVSFSITPKTIPLMKDLQLTVETTGVENVRSARVIVEGVNMFMGYQYVDMQPDSQEKLNGKLILPVCSMEKMQWKATLEVLTDSVKIISIYPFYTTNK